jgi:polysaccharide deacetylase family protein (PEP-CTERM system associated)
VLCTHLFNGVTEGMVGAEHPPYARGTDMAGQTAAPQTVAHMLTFDVEEYFHVEAAAAGVAPEQWESLPRRLPPVVFRLLDLLAAHRTLVTFFVLGWVARRDPNLVRRMAAAGHEIASHGMGHRMVTRLTPDEFRRDIRESRRLLEDLAGRPVVGYRAPTFSITHRTAWALDILAEEGFQYDSSVFPIHHDRYGVPDAPRSVHRALGPGGGSLLEVPPLTARLAGVNWPVGGGGYLRLLPVRAVAAALRAAERTGQGGLLYLHPWELDPDQPLLPMGRLARWRHRVGLHRTAAKLIWLLARFRFGPMSQWLSGIQTSAVPAFSYGNTTAASR